MPRGDWKDRDEMRDYYGMEVNDDSKRMNDHAVGKGGTVDEESSKRNGEKYRPRVTVSSSNRSSLSSLPFPSCPTLFGSFQSPHGGTGEMEMVTVRRSRAMWYGVNHPHPDHPEPTLNPSHDSLRHDRVAFASRCSALSWLRRVWRGVRSGNIMIITTPFMKN